MAGFWRFIGAFCQWRENRNKESQLRWAGWTGHFNALEDISKMEQHHKANDIQK